MCLLPAPSPAGRLVPGPLCGLLVKLPLGCGWNPPHTLAAVLQPLPSGAPAPARHRAQGEVVPGGQGQEVQVAPEVHTLPLAVVLKFTTNVLASERTDRGSGGNSGW